MRCISWVTAIVRSVTQETIVDEIAKMGLCMQLRLADARLAELGKQRDPSWRAKHMGNSDVPLDTHSAYRKAYYEVRKIRHAILDAGYHWKSCYTTLEVPLGEGRSA